MNQKIIDGYTDDAGYLTQAYESISSLEVLSSVAGFPSEGPQRVIDTGAGTGRDAAWFASRGCDVVAVEPVVQIREAGLSLHPSSKIRWVDDALPSLR